jgi:hypothetical protein
MGEAGMGGLDATQALVWAVQRAEKEVASAQWQWHFIQAAFK